MLESLKAGNGSDLVGRPHRQEGPDHFDEDGSLVSGCRKKLPGDMPPGCLGQIAHGKETGAAVQGLPDLQPDERRARRPGAATEATRREKQMKVLIVGAGMQGQVITGPVQGGGGR